MRSEQYCYTWRSLRCFSHYCCRACRHLAIEVLKMIKEITVITGLSSVLTELIGFAIDIAIVEDATAIFIELVTAIATM